LGCLPSTRLFSSSCSRHSRRHAFHSSSKRVRRSTNSEFFKAQEAEEADEEVEEWVEEVIDEKIEVIADKEKE
jgi:hypothetical protein